MSAYTWIPQKPFEETNWQTVQSVGHGGREAESARNELCRLYWYPLYAYVRRQGHSPEDAQELTQEFMSRLIQGTDFGALDPAKGKFRAFLLAAMNNFLANEWRREQAQKRGGGSLTFSINADEAETQFTREPSHNESPARFYDLQWARTLMERALSKLRADYDREDNPFLFPVLKDIVEDNQSDETLASLAQRVSMTPAAFRKALERFRKQYQERLQAEVRLTVSIANQVDEETQFIRKVLRG
jgi:RNA polymerase sigma factor (sigma-70 family)